MKSQYVYSFGGGKAEGRGDDKRLLGGKGAGLAEMTRIGLPVPGGFTITTDACEFYHKDGAKGGAGELDHKGGAKDGAGAKDDSGKKGGPHGDMSCAKWPKGLEQQVRENLARLEKLTKKKLGDAKDPLLVSVRSGAARSMPGMMETILNLGLNDESVEGLAKCTGNVRFARDAYRRFITMYGSTAMGVPREQFDRMLEDIKVKHTAPRVGMKLDPRASAHENARKISDTDVNEDELLLLIRFQQEIYSRHTGHEFPQKPWDQLVGAVNAVFHSWNAEKAVTYRRVEKISDLNGTAVNVQQMVFGNMGDDSGTGVCFTRDPSTGENTFYGDLLINAQGEDVVAGIRTPLKLAELAGKMPEAWEQLCAVRAMLEIHYADMQDMEFTIERGKLYMLQCRTGKRSPGAAFRIAVEQATEPLLSKADAKRLVKKRYLPEKYKKAASKPVISRDQAVMRITAADIQRLFYPVISASVTRDELKRRLLAEAIGAVPGAACGKVVFSAGDAEAAAAKGEAVILVRKETSPEDVGGMHAARGILTQTGGKTSHAAVVARGWGKCCIVGCEAMNIDYEAAEMKVNGTIIRRGDTLTLDGSAGQVFNGELKLETPKLPEAYTALMSWADERRTLKVRTNADSPADAQKAIEMGAEGIGLCRTEHMFFETAERRLAIQEMIVAETRAQRVAALDKLLPFQKADFEGIFEAMHGKPVTVRLIDPPLHEFVPKSQEQAEALSAVTGYKVDQILARSEQLHEANPMLGHRGCRLCITYPEILEMQVKAIISAAIDCAKRGIDVRPEIMIPLTIDAKELRILVERVRAVADGLLADEKANAAKKKPKKSGKKGKAASGAVEYLVGTMIETPRAALLGDKIAGEAEFFSFGTNDLTQTVMALSRDDAGRFLPDYVNEQKAAIFAADPFESLDQDGVGMLVRWAVERGRKERKKLKVGICGEHGGDAESVKFCHRVGMDYVSCSPYRVPIARLAAAQVVIEGS